MDYEQFREQLAEEVQKNLYEKGDVDVNITFNHVEKMNETRNFKSTSVRLSLSRYQPKSLVMSILSVNIFSRNAPFRLGSCIKISR